MEDPGSWYSINLSTIKMRLLKEKKKSKTGRAEKRSSN